MKKTKIKIFRNYNEAVINQYFNEIELDNCVEISKVVVLNAKDLMFVYLQNAPEVMQRLVESSGPDRSNDDYDRERITG